MKQNFHTFSINELNQATTIAKIDQQFTQWLTTQNHGLYKQLLNYRSGSTPENRQDHSHYLIAMAQYLEHFLVEFFVIEPEYHLAQLQQQSNDVIFIFKSWYVTRKAKRCAKKPNISRTFEDLTQWLSKKITDKNNDIEIAISTLGVKWLNNKDKHSDDIDQLIDWCTLALITPEGQNYVSSWSSFRLPQKLDFQALVPTEKENDKLGRLQGCSHTLRQRDGFALTDNRMTQREVLSEVEYCVYCHKNDGDFCSKGFPVKRSQPELGLKKGELGDYLTGCPLDEKISEMHALKKDAKGIAALAMVMLDNPMCPATGHRICNECMKGCIYQKQTPVDIPQVETGTLTDVLNLPWGVEIYHLLTLWNPLKATDWMLQPYNGKKVLIMGMGPAGFTLSHYLTLAGFAVVGCDGLKIEPIDQQLINTPIQHFETITEKLDQRIIAGFGGVAEYGITNRWDKNFLKLIYLTLVRRQYFQVFGGVRFGGTITVEDAWQLGFNHLAIAVGAGLPKALPIKNSMAPGMRQANDFLMALQLTGAAKKESLANLQVRLPAVVIGGGLTGVDTATEVQAYYLAQIEKTQQRYLALSERLGEAHIRAQFDDKSFTVLHEFLTHAHELQSERAQAKQENRKPNLIRLLRRWGGVSIVYRKGMQDSPAYQRNHEELNKALEEGIYYLEGLSPDTVELDEHGHVHQLRCIANVQNEEQQWIASNEHHAIAAKAIFVATGAKPNVAYSFEHQGSFVRKKMEYEAYEDINGQLSTIVTGEHVKAEQFGAFTSYDHNDKRVTFLGDTHPLFHGNVVKAIASAKRTYPKIIAHLNQHDKESEQYSVEKDYLTFRRLMDSQFKSTVISTSRLTPSTIELVVHSPMAVHNFKPGHFYRVQNFETNATIISTKIASGTLETSLQTEAIALLGTKVDQQQGTVTLMVQETGVSSRLVSLFKAGQSISLMGPTGVRTRITPEKPNESVLIVGGRMSIASTLTVATALKEQDIRVCYLASFQTAEELYYRTQLETCCDQIIWLTHTGQPIQNPRPQDRTLSGDWITALRKYGYDLQLESINRVLLIGSVQMIKTLNQERSNPTSIINKNAQWTASVYGPMQCMLKGVCAQCLQWQIDPKTGQRTKAVFACSWHDQPLEIIDLDNLQQRLNQNQMQEKLNNLWLDYLLQI